MAEEYGIQKLRRNFDMVVVTRESPKWYGDDLVPHVQALVPNHCIRRRVADIDIRPRDIGVHFRHGNGERTVVHPNILWFYDKVDKFLKESPEGRVFLCTDCSVVLSRFQVRYGRDRALSSPKEYPPLGSGGMHYAPASDARLKSAIEAAVDMLGLGQCGYFVGGISFFGRVARKLSHPMPETNVATLLRRAVYYPIDGQTPATPESDVGKFLLTNEILLDGLHVTTGTGPHKLFQLFQELGSFKRPKDLNFKLAKERLGYVCLY